MDFMTGLGLFVLGAGGYLLVTQQWTRWQLIRISDWQVAALKKFIASTPDNSSARVALRPGEIVVHELKDATLAETRRGPRISQRRLDAFTFRFAPGFYYTAAGGKSVSPEPIEEMAQIDRGRATFTNKRVVFAGNKHTREWDYSKLLGWNPGAGGYIFMSVSNRQKVSGISGGPREIMAFVVFQLAQIVANDGFDAAKESAKSGVYKSYQQGRFMRENFFAGTDRLQKFVDELDEKLDRHYEKMDEYGVEGWIEPGQKFPPKKPLPAQSSPERTAGNATEEVLAAGATTLEDTSSSYGQVPEELEVVGEFYHPESFATLRELFGTEGDSEHIVEAELRLDPDNPFSESGMAVAVWVKDQHVGHIPEALAPLVYEMVESKGGLVTLGARVYLDHETSKPNKSSVQLFIDSRLTGEKG